MTKLHIILALLIIFPIATLSQKNNEFTTVKTKTTEVRVPGVWNLLNTMDDSGQTYLKNEAGIIIAVAQNPKKAYSFYDSKKSDFKNVIAFYKWDSNYREEINFKTAKIKENSKLEYIIWKFSDGKMDNLFLFGSIGNSFLNLLIYTDIWNENEKIIFLEELYKLNG